MSKDEIPKIKIKVDQRMTNPITLKFKASWVQDEEQDKDALKALQTMQKSDPVYEKHENLTRIGYWKSEYEPNLPDPHDYIDEAYDPEMKAKIVEFLKGGTESIQWAGFSGCRICNERLGTQCWEHEGYMYPQLLWHYIEEHNVRLPKSFEEHVMGRLVANGVEYTLDFTKVVIDWDKKISEKFANAIANDIDREIKIEAITQIINSKVKKNGV